MEYGEECVLLMTAGRARARSPRSPPRSPPRRASSSELVPDAPACDSGPTGEASDSGADDASEEDASPPPARGPSRRRDCDDLTSSSPSPSRDAAMPRVAPRRAAPDFDFSTTPFRGLFFALASTLESAFARRAPPDFSRATPAAGPLIVVVVVVVASRATRATTETLAAAGV
jgi:hypothetical protein